MFLFALMSAATMVAQNNVQVKAVPAETPTAVDAVDAVKSVASVSYVNLAGQVSTEPFNGVNVVVTTYTDGSKSSVKVIK